MPLPVAGSAALWGGTADPDGALRMLERLLERAPDELRPVLTDDAATARLIHLLGASIGLGEFLHRRPAELDLLLEPVAEPWSQERYTASLTEAVDGATGEDARMRLRVRYRRHLAQIALFDVLHDVPTDAFPAVAAGLRRPGRRHPSTLPSTSPGARCRSPRPTSRAPCSR
ncbi:hypothetical protein Q9Q99_02010 [Curtobacterium flaccumfaciens]|nr:hypothetical protein Q9Q99_02010 [Curtobacterium flaccumfaciens]